MSPEDVAARVLSLEPEWCQTSDYVLTLVLSVTLAASSQALSRCVTHQLFSDDKLALDWDSRLVSTANAVLSVWNYLHLKDRLHWSTSSYDAVLLPDCERDLAMTKISGYLLFDGIISSYMIFKQRKTKKRPAPGSYEDPLVLVHHILILFAFGIGIFFRLATSYMAALLLNEVSTPFVNVRALINATCPPSETKRSASIQSIYFLNGLCLAFSYFVFRLLWTAFVLSHAFRAWRDLWRVGLVLIDYHYLPVVSLLTMLLFGHFVINCLWFRHIFNHLRRITATFFGQKHNASENSSSSSSSKAVSHSTTVRRRKQQQQQAALSSSRPHADSASSRQKEE